MGGAISNLDCRTELPDSSPTGLTGFSGEIGIVNIYDQLLDETAISEAFNRVATIGPTGLVVINIAFDDENDEVTLTWNSLDEQIVSGGVFVEFGRKIVACLGRYPYSRH